jgi:hypothetical protein
MKTLVNVMAAALLFSLVGWIITIRNVTTAPTIPRPQIKVVERDWSPEIAELKAQVERLKEIDEVSPIKKDIDSLRANIENLNKIGEVDADLVPILSNLKETMNRSFLNLNTRMEALELKEGRYEYRLRNIENMVVGSVADPAFELKRKGKH